MIKAYDKSERKHIKCTFDDLNKKGYRCCLSIKDLQNFVLVLSEFFNKTKVEIIEELGDYNFYFNYIKSEIDEILIAFLQAHYPARKTLVTFDKDTEYETTVELAYYPVIKNNVNDNDISQEDVSYIIFDEKTGALQKAPRYINATNITSIEELCIHNENSSIYDFSPVKRQIFIHKCDLIMRDLVIECVCIKLMSKREVDLEERLKRTKIFIKSMIANIPNFTRASYLYKMVETMYEENKKETSSGVFGLKKL